MPWPSGLARLCCALSALRLQLRPPLPHHHHYRASPHPLATLHSNCVVAPSPTCRPRPPAAGAHPGASAARTRHPSPALPAPRLRPHVPCLPGAGGSRPAAAGPSSIPGRICLRWVEMKPPGVPKAHRGGVHGRCTALRCAPVRPGLCRRCGSGEAAHADWPFPPPLPPAPQAATGRCCPRWCRSSSACGALPVGSGLGWGAGLGGAGLGRGPLLAMTGGWGWGCYLR